jgi:hypothetical protein
MGHKNVMSKKNLVRLHYPKGGRLPALEGNILKYRALEMVIILFHVENLKKFVLDSIRATDSIHDQNKQRIPIGTKKVYEKAWAVLVADGILTQAESDEVQRLVAYRNDIGHQIHLLTSDISRAPIAQDYIQRNGVKYDYDALKKLKHYRDKIERGVQSKYIMSISFDRLLFEAAEKTYQQELRRLNQKIIRQLAMRREEVQKLKAELSLEKSGLLGEVDPYHPLNKAANGTLTKRGIEICYSLFDHNKSALAVAYLMRISYRAAVNRRRAWERARGRSRQKSQ